MYQINDDIPLGCIYESEDSSTKYCPMCNHDDVPYCQWFEDEPEAAIGIDERPVYCPILPSAPPEPCEYMVSAIAVEEMLKNLLPERGMWEIEGDEAKTVICETVHDALCGLWKLPFIRPDSKEMSFTHKALDTISRQKALDDIETVDPSMLLDVDWVKNWVKALPSAQPKPCEDVVNREDVLEVNFLMPESELVFYDNDHGFCINTQDVLEHIERYVQWER